MRAEGYTWDAIAAKVGLKPQSVRTFTASPEFLARVDELSDEPIIEAMLVLKRNAREAAETVVDVMKTGLAKRDEPRLAAAQDILDRLGVVASAQSEPEQPAIAVSVDIDLDILDTAQRAYVRALRDAAAAVGDGVYASLSPDERTDTVRALPVPGGFPAGSESGADRAESAADGHEPDRGA